MVKIRCSKCKKEIVGEYLKVGSEIYHKDCFTCAKCGKPIAKGYNVQNKKYYHPECYKEENQKYCDYCKKALDASWIESNGKKYHDKCYKEHIQLKCKICGKNIEGEYAKDKNGEYHKSCYHEHFSPKCDVCGKALVGKYIVDHWGNKAHESHSISKTPLCSCCGRIVSEKTSKNGFKLSDGRIICGICKPQAVQNIAYAQKEIDDVKEILKKVGIIIPAIKNIILIDKEKMKVKSTSKDALGFAHTATTKQGKTIVSMEHDIYILHSLQKTLFTGVLAHEMIHTWLNEKQVSLNLKDTEGFCNLGSYLVYMKSSDEIAGYLLKSLDENKDATYGDGYRKMKKELDKLGWSGLIRKIWVR